MKTLCILLLVVSAFAGDTNSAHLRRNSHHHQHGYTYGSYGYPTYGYPAYSTYGYYPGGGASYYPGGGASYYPAYSAPLAYGYGRYAEEAPFLDKKAKKNSNADFVIPSDSPSLSTEDDSSPKPEKNSIITEGKLVFVGMNIEDGKAKFHKVIVTKTPDGKVKVETPDDVIITLPFSLAEGDEKSTVQDGDGTPARLLYINQDDHTGNFFKTHDGKLGFVDFKAFDVGSLAEAEAAIDDFLKQSHEHLKLCFSKLFGGDKVGDTLESKIEKDEKENEELKEKLESDNAISEKESEALKEKLESNIEKDEKESEKLKEDLENEKNEKDREALKEEVESNIEKDKKEIQNLKDAKDTEALKEAVKENIEADKTELEVLEHEAAEIDESA